MKKLFTLLGCLIGLFASGQTIQFLGSPTTQIYVRGQLRVDTIFYLPVRDTLFTPAQVGAFMFKNSNNTAYLWNGLKWNPVQAGPTSWGSLVGTLSAQTDLQSALNAKQNTISAGYGIKISGTTVLFDSAALRKVDTVYGVNDTTLAYAINGHIYNVKIRGSSGLTPAITSLLLNVPGTLFGTPVTFSNTGGAWTGSMILNSQGANTVWSGPTSGSPAQPGFRPLTVADLPINIPNGNLANSSWLLALGTAGTDINWLTSPVSLGGTATLNVPTAGPVNRGLLASADWTVFNGKPNSVNGQTGTVITKSADSIKSLPVDTSTNRQNYLLTFDSTNHKWKLTAGASAGVSSVAMTVPSILNVAGTPINSSGTLAVTLANEAGNTVFAGNAAGSTTTPTFRALVNADFPVSGISAGTYNSVTFNAQGIATAGSVVGSGITSLNGLTAATQTFATGTSGTDFNIVSGTSTHTFNIPTVSGTNRGVAPASGGGTTNFLRADGTWNAPAVGISQVFTKNAPVSILGNDTIKMDTTVYEHIYNVTSTIYNGGAKHDGITNDIPAIQAAINDCVAHGGGTVYFPNGIYGDTGDSLKTLHGNGELYIPAINPSIFGTNVRLKIKGEATQAILQGGGYNPNLGFSKMVTTGVIIRSTLTGSGANPGILVMDTAGSQALNYCDLDIENITLQAYTNHATVAPSVSAFMLKNAATVKLKNDVACMDTTTALVPSPQFSNVGGIVISNQNNAGVNVVEGTMSQGYTYGYVLEGEHLTLLNPYVFQSYYGFVFTKSGYVVNGKVTPHACVYSFYARSAAFFGNMFCSITNLDLDVDEEQDSYFAPGTGTPKWYNWKLSLNDSANLLMGRVNWVAVDSSHNPATIKCPNGGCAYIGITQPYKNIQVSALNIINQGALGSLNLNSGVSVQALDPNKYSNINVLNDAGGIGGQLFEGGSTKAPYANVFGLWNTISGAGLSLGTLNTMPLMNLFDAGNINIKDNAVGATGSNTYPKALFGLVSTTKGSILAPIMTLAQFTAISSKPAGLHAILSDSSNHLGVYDGSKIVMYATTDQLVGGGGSGVTPSNVAKQWYSGFGTFINANTDSMIEGSTNKFYTDARARAAISLTTTGSGAATYSSSTGVLNIPTPAGGGAVSSVSDDGRATLTVSPTTGAVLAGINLGNSNTFTVNQGISNTGGTANGFLVNATSSASLASIGVQNDKGGFSGGTGGAGFGMNGSAVGGGKNNLAFFGNYYSGGGLQFLAGGVEGMRMDSTRHVGIGTTTPAMVLDISTTITDNNLALRNATANSYANASFFNSANAEAQIFHSGTTYSSGVFGSSQFVFAAPGAGGVNISAYNAAGTILLGTGGTSTASVRQRILANGNHLFGYGATTTDNAALLQIAANTTTNAQLFLTGSAADVSSPTNGMLWYNSTAHTLNFRDNGATTNLLAAAVTGANPSGTIGLTAVNGSATTYLRSDGAPALSQAITPTWTNLHTFSAGILTSQIKGSGSAPGNSAGTGMGTGPTGISIIGKDIGGQIQFTTGTLPTGSATIITVTYNTAFPNASFVTITPAADQTLLTGETGVYVAATTTGFALKSGATGLAAGVTYTWYYTVNGY